MRRDLCDRSVPGAPDMGRLAGCHPVLDHSEVIRRAEAVRAIGLLRVFMGYPPEGFAVLVQPVLDRCAKFVQLLPAADSEPYRGCGGRLRHALDLTLRALHARRSRVLPPGVPPEVMGAGAHRWTYGVFIAALLHSAVRVNFALRVELIGDGCHRSVWDPLEDPDAMVRATAYRYGLAEGAGAAASYRAGFVGLYQSWVPVVARQWIAQDERLECELRSWFDEDRAAAGVLCQLLERALGVVAPRASSICPKPAATSIDTGREGARVSRVACVKTDDATARFEEAPSKSDVRHEGASSVVSNAVVPTRPALGAVPTLARAWARWLHVGISGGDLPVNVPGAFIHGVPEGMLLASPQVFKQFVATMRRDPAGTGAVLPEAGVDAMTWSQREVLRAGWHVRGRGGTPIFVYRWREGTDKGANVCGVVIRDPERCIGIAVAINGLLEPVTDGVAKG